MNKNPIDKKYKLTKEQATVFEWLIEQKVNTDDATLCYWTKTYSAKRIMEVVEFAKARINSGQKIYNLGGWIHKFLKSDQIVVNDICRQNHHYAEEFTKANSWKELMIYEKYVKDMVTGDDLPLTIAADEFHRSIEKLYHKSQLYK